MLKELKLAEKRNTGISKIRSALERNGSPMPEYRMDADRSYLEVVFHIHPAFLTDGVPDAASGDLPLRDRILALLESEGCLPASEISRRLGYSRMTGPVRRGMAELMGEGGIRYLYPDNPSDPRQRICRAGARDGSSP